MPDPTSPDRFPRSVRELYQGAVIVVDKPLGWTSFDVVGRIRSHVRKYLPPPQEPGGSPRRFRIGHAGTLDPLATGMLVLCTGQLTREISRYQAGRKIYTGAIVFGQTTPSFDLETAPEGSFPTDHLGGELLREAAAGFLGEQWQTPPAYSAKWVNGKRAYESARAGEEIRMRPAWVEVFAFDLTSISLPRVEFEVTVSKGTYIRSLAHDLGQRVGSGSHLAELRRIACEPFPQEAMLSVEEVVARLSQLPAE